MTTALTVLGLLAGTGLVYWNSGRARLRRKCGRGGWATVRELWDVQPKNPSTRLGATTVGPVVPVVLRVAYEASVLILGGPRRGKSLAAARIAREFRGGAYISSTRFDLLFATIAARRRTGQPVWVFAPEGARGATLWLLLAMEKAGWIKLVRWSPLVGCKDAQVAADRAAAHVDAIDTGAKNDQTWLNRASTVLRHMLHAAALDGLSMREVYSWLASPGAMWEELPKNNPDDPNEEPEYRLIPALILRRHGRHDAADGLASEIFSRNGPGVDSVLQSAREAVEYMDDPAVAATVCPGPDDDVLDVRELIETGQTMYTIGRERQRQGTQPLVAALLTAIFDTADKIASEQGLPPKLPIPFLALADELAVSARIDWDKRLATAGGTGIHMVGIAQSYSQLQQKWKTEGAKTILNLSSNVLIFGGIKADLDMFEGLCGEHTDDEGNKRLTMPRNRIMGLPKFKALHLDGGLENPTILSTARWVKLRELAALPRVIVPSIYTTVREQLSAPHKKALPPSTQPPAAAQDPVRVPSTRVDPETQEVT